MTFADVFVFIESYVLVGLRAREVQRCMRARIDVMVPEHQRIDYALAGRQQQCKQQYVLELSAFARDHQREIH